MIIQVENAARYQAKKLFWKWVNNGKGVLSGRRHAAEFSDDVLGSAVRQVQHLFPEAMVTAVPRVRVKPLKPQAKRSRAIENEVSPNA